MALVGEILITAVRAAVYDRALPQGRRRGLSTAGLALCIVLAIVGFRFGSETYLQRVDEALFYQQYFEPAVAFACTGQMAAVEGHAGVTRFIETRVGVLQTCEGVAAAITPAWNSFDASAVYLYAATAVSWRVFGFSWESLFAVAGLFTAMLAVGSYLFIRCFSASRVLAFGLALAVLQAPIASEHIPHLRDFAKAPLILIGLGAMGYAVLHVLSFRAAMIAAGIVGVVMGLGRGLRPDVLVLAPIALFLFVVLWRGGETWRDRTRQIFCALLSIGSGYIIAAFPLEIVNAGKPVLPGGLPHVFALGFAEHFYFIAGMEPSAAASHANYAALREYVDEHAVAFSSGYHRGGGNGDAHAVSWEVLGRLVAALPHDALMRVFFVANLVGSLSLNHLVYGPISFFVLIAATLTFWRQAVFFILAWGVSVAVLSLQPDVRHAFHMAAFGAALIGLLSTLAIEAVLTRSDAKRTGLWDLSRVRSRAFVTVGVLAAAAAGLWAVSALTRSAQAAFLVEQHQRYQGLVWRTLDLTRTADAVLTPVIANSGPNFIGLAAFEFAFEEEPIEEPLEPAWVPVDAARAIGTPLQEVRAGGHRGYQVVSEPIPLAGLGVAQGEGAIRQLTLRFSGRTGEGGWRLGVLAHHQDQWIAQFDLPEGPFDERVHVQIPPAVHVIQLIWVNDGGGSHVRIEQLTAGARDSEPACSGASWVLRARYRYAGRDWPARPQAVPVSRSGVYYVPVIGFDEYTFQGLAVQGVPVECIREARLATSFPPGMLPVEILALDGAFEPARRAGLGKAWRDFWRWQRPGRHGTAATAPQGS